MKYQPPFVPGATPGAPGIYNADADASYVNGNPSTGQEGSYFPAEAIEHGQREIVKVLTAAGMTPSHESLQQLAEGVSRTASGGTFYGCANTGNAYTLTASGAFVVPASPFLGQLVRFIPSATNTGAATVTFAGVTKALRTWNAAAVAAGDIVSGKMIEGWYVPTANSGAGALLIAPWSLAGSSIWITSDRTITWGPAGADYTTLQAAIDSLDLFLIKPGVKVTLQGTAGNFTISTPVTIRHVHAAQIFIKGVAPSADGAFTQSATLATSETNARAVYTTVFEVAYGIDSGIEIVNGTIGGIEGILFDGSGGATAPVGIRVGRQTTTGPFGDATPVGPGNGKVQKCGFVGCFSGINAASQSKVHLYSCYIANSYTHGVRSFNGSYITGDIVDSRYNGGDGMHAYDSSEIEISNSHLRDNTGNGISGTGNSHLRVNASSVRNNAAYQISVIDDSGYVVTNSVLTQTGGTGSIYANQRSGGRIGSGNSNIGTLSPAANTVGNHNSYNNQ